MTIKTSPGSAQLDDVHDALDRRPLWAIIPAGGSGTRLWPLSRGDRPKVLLPLLGERSLLQVTVDRLDALAGPAGTVVVCGASHAATVARQLPQVPAANILVEPSPRGTAPAIGLAAMLIARDDPDALIGSFAADHDIADPVALHRAVQTAMAAAREGWIVALGLPATHPAVGYGYLERSDEVVAEVDGMVAYRAARFVEKPARVEAERLIASGRADWNAGMVIAWVRSLLAELERLEPALHAGLSTIAAAWGSGRADRVLAEVWPTLPEATFDVAIMERAARVAVVPVDVGRSDIGDWDGLAARLPPDAHGNSGAGDRLSIDTHRSVVWSAGGRVVTVIGLDGVAVVDTGDAVLVTSRASAQEVKRVVDQLKRGGRQGLT